MKKEWMDYYIYLEELRKSGIVNMFGARPYLEEHFNIDKKLAEKILLSWIKNYDEIIEIIKDKEQK